MSPAPCGACVQYGCAQGDCQCPCHHEDVQIVIKACPCGAEYDTASWAELPYNGLQKMDPPDEPDSGERIELRTCTCGSTISVLVCAEEQP